MKHAPRGPLKAKAALMDMENPMNLTPGGFPKNGEALRCTATAKGSGARCKKPAIVGGNVCPTHGGSAPQVKAAAAFRVLDAYRALQPKCVAVVDGLLSRDEYPTVQIAAVREVMDRTEGKPRESMEVTGADKGPLEIVIRKPWTDSK